MMTTNYRGHVENGVIVLDEPADLAEGTAVEVRASAAAPRAQSGPGKARGYRLPTGYNEAKADPGMPTLYESLKAIIGTGSEDLPSDLASQHEHYRLGTPKR